MSFFASRWVEAPTHVRELPGGLPAGFRAAGVACGIKPSGQRDLGVMVSDAEGTASAARFTRSGVLAAPVLLCQQRCDLGGLRVIAANAGSANCATGRRGLDDAAKVQGAAAMITGVSERQVAVASTGAIAHELPADKLVRGLALVVAELRAEGAHDLTEAICTTDAFPKHVSLEVELPSGTVSLSAQAKGAGMISPAFATMFCFVQTDVAMSAKTAQRLLDTTLARSFERISVDGQLSTNDTAILMANGSSEIRVEPDSDDELALGQALDAVMRQLALMIVRDGEGARRVGRVVVSGGHEAHVEGAARAIGDSPLVKAALHGGDPNWGRIAQSLGMALPGAAPLTYDIAIEGMTVCSQGAGVPYDQVALGAAVQRDEVEYRVGLPGDGARAEVFFSDLSHEYVTINAEYTT